MPFRKMNSQPTKSSAATPPAFDPKTAQPVTLTRHEPTGRTFGFVQGDHLFSATGVFVATDAATAKAAVPAKA